MSLDLAAYLDRIGYGGPATPTVDVAREVHLAHALAIPFENVDVLAGTPIRLDVDALQDKLVARGRGGYCFEHNTLFAAALEALGFGVTKLAARVRTGTRRPPPRTHLVLRVQAEGAAWLADVGFGGLGPLRPIPFAPGEPPDQQFGWRYRLAREGPELVLELGEGDAWTALYGSTLEPQLDVDVEMANHYTATHPSSPFTRTLTAQRPDPADPSTRVILRGRKLAEERPDGRSTATRVSDEDLLEVLAGRFGIRLPPGTILP